MRTWEGGTFHSEALCNTNNTRLSWEHYYFVKTFCIQEDKTACEGGRRRCTDRRKGSFSQLPRQITQVHGIRVASS